MAEPREIQRLHRMKLAANKKMDLLANHPKHPKVKRWTERLKELAGSIAIAEHEAKAAAVRKAQATGGVEIAVPVKHFAVTPVEPEAAA